MTTSEHINELAGALAKAQSEMEGAAKTSSNPFFKSKYPDLKAVREACIPALTKYGIAVVQSPSVEGTVVSIETMLVHSSGQWVRGIVSCTAKDDSAQSVGSATTYLRRYSLQSFAGVAAEDDDGEAAQGRTSGQKAQPVGVPNIPKGYQDWLLDLAAIADEGYVRFRQGFKDSKLEYREYLSKTDAKRLEALVEKSKQVSAAKSDKVSA